jgi:hypothetical protein
LNLSQAYNLYLGLRLHFTQPKFTIGRDFIPAKESTLEKQTGLKFALQRFCRIYSQLEFAQYLVANHVAGDKYGGAFQAQKGKEIYFEWKKHHEGLTYYFQEEMAQLAQMVSSDRIGIKLEELWDCSKGHPPILRAFFGQTAPLETLAILNKVTRFQDTLDTQLSGDPAWKDTSRLLNKYVPFLDADVERFKPLIYKTFEA